MFFFLGNGLIRFEHILCSAVKNESTCNACFSRMRVWEDTFTRQRVRWNTPNLGVMQEHDLYTYYLQITVIH